MQLTPGQLVNNRYHILRLLGQGGMGAVYLAEDNSLPGRQVAVKENADPSQSAQDQFKREAVILARLKHPNLPQVTDHFLTPSGSQYLVMDYVPGEDLDKILTRRGPLPEAEVVGWMVQVFDALEYMHTWVDPTTGMLTPAIHRDIKPGNIKLTPQGRIMLVDFGIAKFQGGTGTLTGAGGLAGLLAGGTIHGRHGRAHRYLCPGGDHVLPADGAHPAGGAGTRRRSGAVEGTAGIDPRPYPDHRGRNLACHAVAVAEPLPERA